ncbi:hypothetical protein F2Q68_00000072 [Brassica cretica]|uniref:Uncharacterized protein n=1 Tax=Brassica cretica TaxID=69181 RepID=A0A8S9JN94_BRACR|nr:hypothetical protein F2Q68_00000072 [Brassica cretica]
MLLQRRDKSKAKRQNSRTLTQRWLQKALTEATGKELRYTIGGGHRAKKPKANSAI